MEKFLTAKEVAELFNCSPSTINSWATSGKIPSHKICGLRRFQISEIETFILNSKMSKVKTEPLSKSMIKTSFSRINVGDIIEKCIVLSKNNKYNTPIGETGRTRARKGKDK